MIKPDDVLELSEQNIGYNYEEMLYQKSTLSLSISNMEVELQKEMEALPVYQDLLLARNDLQIMDEIMSSQKESLLAKMLLNGIKSIETHKLKFTTKANPGTLKITDESIIPELFFTIPKPQPNKVLIKEAIKEGNQIPGCEIEKGYTLVVSTK